MSEGMGAAGWVPAFEGQRPPFQAGNELAVKHGAQSPRLIEPIAQALVAEILADDSVGYLREPKYASAVQAWAVAEAKAARVADWLDGMSMEEAAQSGQGRTPPLELWRKLDSTAANHRARLGLDPVSAARLGKDIAQTKQADVATEMTKLREQHERATHAPIQGEVADDGEN